METTISSSYLAGQLLEPFWMVETWWRLLTNSDEEKNVAWDPVRGCSPMDLRELSALPCLGIWERSSWWWIHLSCGRVKSFLECSLIRATSPGTSHIGLQSLAGLRRMRVESSCQSQASRLRIQVGGPRTHRGSASRTRERSHSHGAEQLESGRYLCSWRASKSYHLSRRIGPSRHETFWMRSSHLKLSASLKITARQSGRINRMFTNQPVTYLITSRFLSNPVPFSNENSIVEARRRKLCERNFKLIRNLQVAFSTTDRDCGSLIDTVEIFCLRKLLSRYVASMERRKKVCNATLARTYIVYNNSHCCFISFRVSQIIEIFAWRSLYISKTQIAITFARLIDHLWALSGTSTQSSVWTFI